MLSKFTVQHIRTCMHRGRKVLNIGGPNFRIWGVGGRGGRLRKVLNIGGWGGARFRMGGQGGPNFSLAVN